MNAAQLLDHFGELAEVPGGIARLRGLVFDLAIRGKLVKQDPNDEPASALLSRIALQKGQLGFTGSSSKLRLGRTEHERAFSIPSGWEWTQIEQIGLISPRNETEDACEVSFVPMAMIPSEWGRDNQHEIRRWGEIKKGFSHIAEGDVGLAKITPSFENGKSAVFKGLTGGLGSGSTELHVVRPIFVDPDYILLFLKSPFFISSGIPRMTGTAGQKRVPVSYFAFTPMPLPPRNEQSRIVAKVNELIRLCDELDNCRNRREGNRDRLVASTLHDIEANKQAKGADTSNSGNSSRNLYLNQFPRLTTRSQHVDRLRQTILALAVQGRLVRPEAGEEPASKLLDEIEAARIKQGTGVKKKSGTLVPTESLGFDVPKGWVSAPLGNLTTKLGAGSTPLGGKAVYGNDGVPFLRSQNVYNPGLKLEDVALIPRSVHDKMQGTKLQQNDILLNITGASIGRCALLPAELGEGNVSQHVAIVRLIKPELREFIHLSLISPAYQRLIREVQVGVSREGLSMARLSTFPMLLPPLAEQKRIVSEVNRLFALCDQLEQLVNTSDTYRQRLLDAVFH